MSSAVATSAVAGPPLAIDDPGVLDPGQWEVIGAVTFAKSDAGHAAEVPIADISYGLTPNTQVSAAYPYVFVHPTDDSATSDFGNLSIGFKWRFFDSEKLQVAFAPGVTFGISLNAAKVGIGDDTHVELLPVNFQYALGGDWTLNGELGLALVHEGEDEWAYGLAIGHPVGNRTQLMFELYGATNSELDDNVLNFHVGVDIEIRPALHVLAAAGSGIREPAGSDQLDFDLYLGLQYFK